MEKRKNIVINGILLVGGLSESGKSTIGIFLEKYGFKRLKIIEIEKEMMKRRNFDIEKGLSDSHFEKLYSGKLEDIFDEFLDILNDKFIRYKYQFCVLESLYRVELGIHLKKRLGDKVKIIYVDADFKKRILREHIKLNKTNNEILLEEVEKQVLLKDKFKMAHGAHNVREFADLIITNNSSLEEFKSKILNISNSMRKKKYIDNNKFNNLESLIKHLISIKCVVGIIQYGSRDYKDMKLGGDYDLTVIIENNDLFPNVEGLHFYVGKIPVDFVIRTISDFKGEKMKNKFDIIHFYSKIIYDRNSILEEILKEAKDKWNYKENRLDYNNITKLRFRLTHVINKLEHRLHNNFIYSMYYLNEAIRISLKAYIEIKSLHKEVVRVCILHIKENDNELEEKILTFYNTTNLEEKFLLIKKIIKMILEPIGGLWEENEILFHGNKIEISNQEKIEIFKLFFNQNEEN